MSQFAYIYKLIFTFAYIYIYKFMFIFAYIYIQILIANKNFKLPFLI